MKCDVCCGTGWIMKRDGDMFEAYDVCPRCRGTGEAPNGISLGRPVLEPGAGMTVKGVHVTMGRPRAPRGTTTA